MAWIGENWVPVTITPDPSKHRLQWPSTGSTITLLSKNQQWTRWCRTGQVYCTWNIQNLLWFLKLKLNCNDIVAMYYNVIIMSTQRCLNFMKHQKEITVRTILFIVIWNKNYIIDWDLKDNELDEAVSWFFLSTINFVNFFCVKTLNYIAI